MKQNEKIDSGNLGNGLVIKNDVIISTMNEQPSDNGILDLDSSFAEIIKWAEAIDKYYDNKC